MHIGFLHSIIRPDEKMLLSMFAEKGIEVEQLDVRTAIFDFSAPLSPEIDRCSLILERAVSFSKGSYALQVLESKGKKTLNTSALLELCGDKIKTSLLLEKNKIPTIKTVLALSPESALEAIETMGYPVVLKPPVGSWGRLLAKINDRDAAEAIIEHKSTLGSYQHELFYIQEYVKKPGRDIRIVVVGDKAVAGMYRNSEHWITNAARGGNPEVCPITSEIKKIIDQIVSTFGEGLMGIDLFETNDGLKVVEVNAGVEFKAISRVSESSIPEKIVDYAISLAK
jgi:[lysine-biosynthesis-protein LysW]--L-2-aminoadipate ligase